MKAKMRVYETLLRFMFSCLAATLPNLRRSFTDKFMRLRRDAKAGIPPQVSPEEGAAFVRQFRKDLDEAIDYIESGLRKR